MNELKNSYCNPLAIPSIPVGRNAGDKENAGDWWREFGDPTVIRFKERYYLFPSCGMIWYSDDMIHWHFQAINLYDVGWAPTVTEKAGRLYLSASWEGSQIWTTEDPLGHWECLGEIRDENNQPLKWADPALFTDDDGTIYAYYSLGVNRGIFVARLRDDDVTRFAGAPVHCFAYNPEHKWERFGEFNQNPYFSHLEGASMTKYNCKYYLQYSAAGAEWRNYAVGCYIADSPTGPFRYQKRNPVLIQRHGMINGCGHNSIVEGPDGELWCFYTILMRRYRGLERRIAMDIVRFDENGEMYVDGPSETPRFLDGSYPDKVANLTSGQPVRATSFVPGHESGLAIDNYIRTWYEADPSDWQPSLNIDLQGRFNLMGGRFIFNEKITPHHPSPAFFGFLIEYLSDGDNWTILCDRRNADFDGHIRYETWDTVTATRVRLTITQVPSGNIPGVIDFSIFGKAEIEK